jgi:uncharacterized protein (TIGR01777 family)
MKNRKIIIAGGTGFIGEELTRYFGKENDIVVLTRGVQRKADNRNNYNSLKEEDLHRVRYVNWNGKDSGDWINCLDNTDIIINLTGKTVNCRYTEANKKEILESRINAVAAIGAAIAQCRLPPTLWINASSATIYRHALDKPQDEYSEEFHDGFSVNVCREWEKTFYAQAVPTTRKVALRMAITLGPGGVLIPYFNLLKFGLGGRQGSGRQMFSWVHIEDTCRMIEWIAKHEELKGTFNCVAPHPVTNEILMSVLRSLTGKRFGLPAYEWMLKAGAMMIGTETELVLKSRWVLPVRILETGFIFKYPDIREALTNIISKVPRQQYQLF